MKALLWIVAVIVGIVIVASLAPPDEPADQRQTDREIIEREREIEAPRPVLPVPTGLTISNYRRHELPDRVYVVADLAWSLESVPVGFSLSHFLVTDWQVGKFRPDPTPQQFTYTPSGGLQLTVIGIATGISDLIVLNDPAGDFGTRRTQLLGVTAVFIADGMSVELTTVSSGITLPDPLPVE